MREALILRILKDLGSLLVEEAAQNPQFAARLDSLLATIPVVPKKPVGPKAATRKADLPDLFSEAKSRSASELELWLQSLEVPILKALIKKHELDTSNKWQRWRDPEKFAKLICEQFHARMQRGSHFLSSDSVSSPERQP